MSEDVPVGDLTRSVKQTDIERVRYNEARMDRQGWLLVRSLVQHDGVAVGYTSMFLSRHDPGIVVQDNTLVDRNHRRNGVGRALKIANLRQLQELDEASDPHWIQTWTATSNQPMLALNRAIGFRVADTMTALEGPIGGCGGS